MVTNNRNKTCIVASGVYTWVCLKAVKETTQFSSVQSSPVSLQDASDRLARTFPAVHFACSRGKFCKSQCNQRKEQVGEDFSGTSRINSFSGVIGLHWTARPIEWTPVKGNTPNSLPRSRAVSRLQLQSPGHRIQPPTSNIKSSA
jgi:hypothetical protein